MKSFNKIAELAKKFEKKIAGQSAQPGDIEKALTDAGVWKTINDLMPHLDAANVPADAHGEIKLRVKPDYTVDFTVTPAYPAFKALIDKNYATAMSGVLKKTDTAPTEPMLVNIGTF